MSVKIIKRELQDLLTAKVAQHNVAGASLAIFNAGELTTAIAGVANVTTGMEITPETVMHIGSITKVFNATLIMQLVDEGKVKLDELAVTYVPDLQLRDQEALKQITVGMLLNHTSGIDGEWILPDRGHDEETIEKGVRRFADLGQVHRPGRGFGYCNAATVIAGYLAQRVAGKSWYALVREKIFEPLGMQYAVALPEDALLHRASVGHFCGAGGSSTLVRSSHAFLSLSFAPAGSTLMMSATDLITFARAHMRNGLGVNGVRILSENSARAMRQMTVCQKSGHRYRLIDGMGIGWMLYDNGILHHSGGGPGVISSLYVYPDHEFAVAILTNSPSGFGLINEIVEPWLNAIGNVKPLGIVDVKMPKDAPPVEQARYVGVYEDVVNRFFVSKTKKGIALSRQAKAFLNDIVPTEPTVPVDLIPLGEEQFLLAPQGADAAKGVTSGERIFTFSASDGDGQRYHLENSLRVYPRVRRY